MHHYYYYYYMIYQFLGMEAKNYKFGMFCQQCHPSVASGDADIRPRNAYRIHTCHLFTVQFSSVQFIYWKQAPVGLYFQIQCGWLLQSICWFCWFQLDSWWFTAIENMIIPVSLAFLGNAIIYVVILSISPIWRIGETNPSTKTFKILFSIVMPTFGKSCRRPWLHGLENQS